MSLRILLFGFLLLPVQLLADLHFSAGSNFASVYTIQDPVTSTALAAGNVVYLIYDADGDGALADVNPSTGAVLAPDILLGTYSIGDGAFAPFTSGGLSGQIDFPALNVALLANGNATQAQLYLRVFNVPNPATAPVASGTVYYGDSYASDASVITEASAWTEVGGYFQYDKRMDDSPLQPQWTVGTVVLNTQLQLPNTPPVADAGSPQTVVDSDGSGAELVTLNGSASSDSDGTVQSWDWRRLGSSIASGAMPSVSLPVGIHTLELIVADDDGATDTNAVLVTVEGNLLPAANAGPNQTVVDVMADGSEVVQLDGSSSSDTDGTLVSYVWSVGGSTVATGVMPTVTLVVGSHTLLLTVTDNDGGSQSDSVVITVEPNALPLADAGPVQLLIDVAGDGRETVILDASASSDSDGSIVSYSWSLSGSVVASGSGPSLSLPVGVHTLILLVTDDDGATDTDTVVITVEANIPPVADAGPDQTLVDAAGDGSESVLLDGRLSSDADGTIVRFDWHRNGSLMATGQTPSVVLPVGTHTLILSVTDNDGATGTNAVEILVEANALPVANAGPNQSLVDVAGDGSEAFLIDGSSSMDSDGTIITFVWTLGGTQIATGATASVILPVGTNLVLLTVTDNDGGQHTDSVSLIVDPNVQPVADAGSDQMLVDVFGDGGELVTLDGTASTDPDGSISSYTWHEGGLTIASGPSPNISLAVGTHDLILTVTDNDGASHSDAVRIIVEGNLPPVADAGANQTIVDADENGSESITLNGTGSLDTDGIVTAWQWSESGTPLATGATASVVLSVGAHNIDLVVTDDDGASHTDQVSIVITTPNNLPPTAVAGNDLTLTDTDGSGDEPVSLSASASTDSDGTIVAVQWSVGGAVLAATTNAALTLDVGTHSVQLRVTDDDGATDIDTLVVTILPRPNTAPLANAGGLILVIDVDGDGAETVTLDGTASSDSDGSLVSYDWSISGSTIATGSTVLVSLAVGVHLIDLTVTDDDNAIHVDQVQVTVLPNAQPIAAAGPNQSLVDAQGDGAELVQLDGSGSSDPDGSIVSWEWRLNGVLLSMNASPVLTVSVGSHQFDLTVTDNLGAMSSDSVVITVDANLPPVADAGTNQMLLDIDEDGAEIVNLNGSASTDSDGSIASYTWLENGLTIATGASPSLSLTVGSHLIDLVVTDNDGGSHTDMVSVVISIPNNVPPVAVAGPAQTIVNVTGSGSEVVVLDGRSSSDIDGSIISHIWSEAGAVVASVSMPSLTLTVGAHLLELVVTDEDGASATNTVLITIVPNPQPVAQAGPNQVVADPDGDGSAPVLLDGTASSDDDPIAMWVWSENGSILGTGPLFTATLPVGVHTVMLTVVDSQNAMQDDTLVVTVNANQSPLADAGMDQVLIDADRNGSEHVSLLALTALDPDGSLVSQEWWIGNSIVTTGSSAMLSLPLGTTIVYFVVTDHGGASTTDSVTIAVNSPANTPPVFGSFGLQRLVVGDPFVLPLGAMDPDVPGQTLTYQLIGSPPVGATIDPGSGALSWTPVATDAGASTLTIRVSDGVTTTDLVLQVDVAEIPHILSFVGFIPGAGMQDLSFSAKSGFTYQLQHSPTLDTPVWTTVANLTANASAEDVQNALPSVRVGYYRVIVLP